MPDDWNRRAFLQGTGAVAPTCRLMLAAYAQKASAAVPGRFTTVELDRFFNCSPAAFGKREALKWSQSDELVSVPGGDQTFRGIPFRLGPAGVDRNRWIALSTRSSNWTTAQVDIPVNANAGHVCLAQFCDWDPNQVSPATVDDVQRIGETLAEAVLVFADGPEAVCPIRRRFEVNPPIVPWGERAFLALDHPQLLPATIRDPLPTGIGWGALQTNVRFESTGQMLWIAALKNPHPEKPLKSVRMRARSADVLALCGLTLFHGEENPLQYEALGVYRIALPEPKAGEAGRWKVTVDLGVVARVHQPVDFQPEHWLNSPLRGNGEFSPSQPDGNCLYAEVSASRGATLSLHDSKTGKRYDFELARAAGGQEVEARPAGARVQFLTPQKTWLHAKVTDAATGQPTPVRLAFLSKEGRYLAPYGHRTQMNPGWFQDYGADVKILDSSYAYVDGTFQIELPVGEVYVEIAKGFEYEPIRQKLQIAAGQRELNLQVKRFVDLRSKGWITADTHVHFLSPSTALLEGQAEGLNLINLLAAQWGDLFTNIGDLSHGPLTTRDGETIVWPGTENRSHMLGHINLLGGSGEPVLPLTVAFPTGADEAWFGTPLWTSMAEWADRCRAREGLTVAPHFPFPTSEIAADIVLGKIDAVELPSRSNFRDVAYMDYYRYLNCGYRLPAAGGTDKMSAGTAVGAARTYAYLGNEQFSFAGWAKAVRSGNTFVSHGPLLLLKVDGHAPGSEIVLGAGGGTLEVELQAISPIPFWSLEIVHNGRVVEAWQDAKSTREKTLKTRVRADGPGWIAARCEAQEVRRPAEWYRRRPAHTSPVYLRAPGKELFSPPAAKYFLSLIDGTEAWAKQIATPPGDERLGRILSMLKDAREQLHRRLHAHGIAHA